MSDEEIKKLLYPLNSLEINDTSRERRITVDEYNSLIYAIAETIKKIAKNL